MDFIRYVSKNVAESPKESISNLVQKAGGIEYVYLIFIDILKGFCEQGDLSSVRVKQMVEPVTILANRLLQLGLPERNIAFINDHHPVNATEFNHFVPHCIAGTEEAEVVEALKPIQQKEQVQTFHKNAINGMFATNTEGTRFFEWIENIFVQGKSSFIIVGDCTDLRIYQNAMGIRLLANEQNVNTDVIVPISHVETYDIPIKQAEEQQILAHDADTLEAIFLYHMKLDGVTVIARLE